jgi:cytoskeletal protein CcmA (bactofilin family)
MFKKETAVSNGKIDTLIGAGTTIEGKINATGILRVEGRVRGEVVSEGDVMIGEKGEIRANIKARHVTIAGKVTGNINASGRMHLMATATLLGDVDAATVVIEEGAHFKGACRMHDSQNGSGSEPSSHHSDSMKETLSSDPIGSGTTSHFQTASTERRDIRLPFTDAPQW